MKLGSGGLLLGDFPLAVFDVTSWCTTAAGKNRAVLRGIRCETLTA